MDFYFYFAQYVLSKGTTGSRREVFHRKVSLTPELSWLESRANNVKVMGTFVLGANSGFIKYSLVTIVVKL